MATVLSQGFVISPVVPTAIRCATARVTYTQSVTTYIRSGCTVSNCQAYIKRVDLVCPQHNDRTFLVTIRDQDGDLLDVSGATEITFIVSRNVRSAPIITKTRTGGTVGLTTNSQLQIDISDVESGGLQPGNNYYEIEVINSAGSKYTALAGKFVVEDTRISD